MKKYFLIILVALLMGCADGGNICPERTIVAKYELHDGSMVLDLIRAGSIHYQTNNPLSQHYIPRVVTNEKCVDLLEKYKAKQIRRLE